MFEPMPEQYLDEIRAATDRERGSLLVRRRDNALAHREYLLDRLDAVTAERDQLQRQLAEQRQISACLDDYRQGYKP